jgi:putative membrane protein
MMGFAGGLGMLLFWALVIGGIAWLVVTVSRNQAQPGTPRPAGETALDVLKRRYAAGEINKEQFDEMRRQLEV